MEKLTLENIPPYLPYGLKGTFSTLPKGNRFTISGYETDDDEALEFIYVIGSCGPYGGQRDLIHNFTPYLRPMDLTKPIQVEGKEIIPIVELAKISFDRIYFENWLQGDRAISKEIEKNKRIRFWYLKKEQSFQTTLCGKQHVTNQLDLFQWLFKHKLDVFNLIDRGLAIDVNTLETNPYE